jgi:hypothetical protein
LLNISTTDHISQGKTRPKNPVDLSSCKSHQSYYICLSRSATASGTVIVQSFSPQLITCGASGYLRQEFHELELLDEITKLRYEDILPDHIQGNFRNLLIRAYQTWKGTNYVPELTHPALKWSAQDPFHFCLLLQMHLGRSLKRKAQIRKRKTLEILRWKMMLHKFSLDLSQLKEVYLSTLARKEKWKM